MPFIFKVTDANSVTGDEQIMETKDPGTGQGRAYKPSSFEFVTFSDLSNMRDALAISRIRKHAMQDIGKARRRPNKHRKGYIEVALELGMEDDLPLPSPAVTGFGEGGIDPFLRFPVKLDAFGRELIVNIFNKDSPRALRDDWFTVSLGSSKSSGPAQLARFVQRCMKDVVDNIFVGHTFKQLLGNEALHVNVLRQLDERSSESARATYYHQDALTEVRTQLQQSPVIVTEALIGTVAGFLCGASVALSLDPLVAHRNGLLGLLRGYKGGLDALAQNVHLRSTVSWVDLRGAYLQDLPCKVPLPRTWVEQADSFLHRRCGVTALHSAQFCSEVGVSQLGLPRAISNMFQTIGKCSEQMMADISSPDTGPANFESPAWVNVALHRLLCFRLLRPTHEEENEAAAIIAESCRLALLLYLAPIWKFYGAHPVITEVLVRKQYELLRAQAVALRWDEEWWDVRLWILCVSFFEAARLPDRGIGRWYIAQIADFGANRSGLSDALKRVLWIPLLFDQPLESLQREVEVFRQEHPIRLPDEM